MPRAQLDRSLVLLATIEAAPPFKAFNKLAPSVDELMDVVPGDPELRELQRVGNNCALYVTIGAIVDVTGVLPYLRSE